MGNPRNKNINKSGQASTKLTCQLKVIPIDHGSAAKYLWSTHGRLFIFDRGTSKYPPAFVFLSLKLSAKSQEVVSNQYFNTQNRIPLIPIPSENCEGDQKLFIQSWVIDEFH